VPRFTNRGLAALVALGALAVPAAASAKPVITMSGSTTVAPLVEALAPKYLSACHHCVTLKLAQGGSDVGVNDVAHGKVSIGNSSRDPLSTDPGGLHFNKIARDAVCLITNKSNPISNLGQKAIQDIFSGTVRNWSQVPGARAHGAIDLYTRTSTSGTADAFERIFMFPKNVSSTAAQKSSNGQVQQGVIGDPNGIGYVSLDFVKNANAVPYNGVACNLRNAKSGSYGGVRNLYMVTRGNPTGAAKAWIHWIQTSAAAKKVVATDWVPLG